MWFSCTSDLNVSHTAPGNNRSHTGHIEPLEQLLLFVGLTRINSTKVAQWKLFVVWHFALLVEYSDNNGLDNGLHQTGGK